MKKLMILVAALAVYNVNILADDRIDMLKEDVKDAAKATVNTAKAIKSTNSNYCKCKNGSLESVSCDSACWGKNGWSGKTELTPEGVRCICKNNKDGSASYKDESCSSYGRCIRSGFAGQVYTIADGADAQFVKVPAKK